MSHQAGVSQYLSAKIPLNLATALKFAKILRVSVKDISPRFAEWTEPFVTLETDRYQFPKGGQVGGYETPDCVSWLAFSKDFLQEVGADALDAIILRDDSNANFPPGTLLLVARCDGVPTESGFYLMVHNKVLVVRQIEFDGEEATVSSATKITISRDTLGMMQVLGRVVRKISEV